ncbi:alkaline phosphatase PhoX [Calothrix rhizosoleniae]
MSNISRRQFITLASAAAAGTAMAPMGLLQVRRAIANDKCFPASFTVDGFGTLSELLPLNTSELGDVPGKGDLRNTPLLRLPKGFQYTAIGIRGVPMSDGVLTPGDHDGMAAFPGSYGNTILVRNHELSIDEDEAGNTAGCLAPNGNQYDPFTGNNNPSGFGGGGTSTIIVDRYGNKVKDYVSLGGTIRNCAGGPTPWGSWISCEENVSTPATDGRNTKKHGYNFEVPSELGEAVDPIPLVEMGRMNHEAVSVGRDGIVYETEDRGDSIYYKYVPKIRGRARKFGDLQEGGDLYAMVIDKDQKSNCNGASLPINELQGTKVVDTRGLGRGDKVGSMLPFLGQSLKVSWVKLEDVDPEEDTLRFEAQSKGAAVFWRGEGAWYHRGKHYWVCSGAGDAAEGQVWCYDPDSETVTMIVESTDENLLDGPDNMTVAFDGTIYLCEDGTGGNQGDANFSQYIVGVDEEGGLFQFAHNIIPDDTSEFGGACFSPDGRYMYVNSQGIGITYCIWREDGRLITPRTYLKDRRRGFFKRRWNR